jgi:pimeloyl-ACP methyl ester carboxylesterase
MQPDPSPHHDTLLREGRPSPLLLLAEWRAVGEAASLLAAWPWLRRAPRGDGHPVLVLPGLWAGDASTWPLRRFLQRQRLDAQPWLLGRNLGPRSGVLEALAARLQHLHQGSGRRVSLVGWSLGGLFARELARAAPHAVRQVVSLGSPLYGDPRRNTNSWLAYRLAAGRRNAQAHAGLRGHGAPPVPTTSVFSRGDGVVGWRACVEQRGAQVQNVQVPGSHLGYGVNPWVWWLLADRLAQPEEGWRPFTPPLRLRRGWRVHG